MLSTMLGGMSKLRQRARQAKPVVHGGRDVTDLSRTIRRFAVPGTHHQFRPIAIQTPIDSPVPSLCLPTRTTLHPVPSDLVYKQSQRVARRIGNSGWCQYWTKKKKHPRCIFHRRSTVSEMRRNRNIYSLVCRSAPGTGFSEIGDPSLPVRAIQRYRLTPLTRLTL